MVVSSRVVTGDSKRLEESVLIGLGNGSALLQLRCPAPGLLLRAYHSA